MIVDMMLGSPTLGCAGTQVTVRPRLTIKRIQDVVAEFYDIAAAEMTSDRRGRDAARPRQIAMYLARNLTPKSLPDIGARFGGRDHTTVLHALRRIEALRQVDDDLHDDLTYLEGRLNVRRYPQLAGAHDTRTASAGRA